LIFLRQFRRVAKIIGADRTAAAVLAKVLRRANQLDKFLGVGFYKPLFLEGAQCFFTGIAHRLLLSMTNIAASELHESLTERTRISINIHWSDTVKPADLVREGRKRCTAGGSLLLFNTRLNHEREFLPTNQLLTESKFFLHIQACYAKMWIIIDLVFFNGVSHEWTRIRIVNFHYPSLVIFVFFVVR